MRSVLLPTRPVEASPVVGRLDDILPDALPLLLTRPDMLPDALPLLLTRPDMLPPLFEARWLKEPLVPLLP